MNNKKTFLIIVAFVVLLSGASLLYNYMSDKVKPNQFVVNESNSTNQSQESSDSSNGEESNTGAGEEQSANPAPDFAVTDKNGNEHKLSDYIGKPIVLNFWASWCGPCKSEMPDFDEVYKEYQGAIEFLMVNLTDGSRETVKTASDYISDKGYSFPVYFDTMSEAAMTYRVYSVPTTYFIDENGNLIAQAQGAIDKETLLRGIGMIYEK